MDTISGPAATFGAVWGLAGDASAEAGAAVWAKAGAAKAPTRARAISDFFM